MLEPTCYFLGVFIVIMAESYLLEKLKSVEQTFYELTRRLADPDTAGNPDEYQKNC